jgi:hypothetical protein
MNTCIESFQNSRASLRDVCIQYRPDTKEVQAIEKTNYLSRKTHGARRSFESSSSNDERPSDEIELPTGRVSDHMVFWVTNYSSGKSP